MKRKNRVESDASTAVAEETAPRIIVRIELTPAAKTSFGQVAKRMGMTQVSTTSRLVEWFSQQPEGVQAAILGQFPKEIEQDVVRMILAKM